MRVILEDSDIDQIVDVMVRKYGEPREEVLRRFLLKSGHEEVVQLDLSEVSFRLRDSFDDLVSHEDGFSYTWMLRFSECIGEKGGRA